MQIVEARIWEEAKLPVGRLARIITPSELQLLGVLTLNSTLTGGLMMPLRGLDGSLGKFLAKYNGDAIGPHDDLAMACQSIGLIFNETYGTEPDRFVCTIANCTTFANGIVYGIEVCGKISPNYTEEQLADRIAAATGILGIFPMLVK